MSGARLPSVRLPALAGDEDGSDVVVVELLPASRFGIAWPAEPPPPMSAPAERPAGASLSSSEGETDISEEESAHTRPRSRADECEDSEFVTPTNYMHADRNPLDHASPPPTAPRISRAFSMPLASQLGPFQNPRRVLSSDASPPAGPSEEPVHLQDLSLELADSVQMVIQTLLQLSPPQVLDPAKEQFSACSLSIPTPSISAMFTSMKNLNYMSANMTTFSVDAPASSASSTVPGRSRAEPGASAYVDFDVGEMLQSVGDALSGIAAQAGVDLVLFHDDLGMRHVAVKGDESGLSYTLSHILRQIISVAHQGDSIEIGLLIESATTPPRSASRGSPFRSDSPNLSLDPDAPLRCTFHIAHRFGMQEPSSAAAESEDPSVELDPSPSPPSQSDSSARNQPSFQSLILRRLLQHIGAHLETDVRPRSTIVGRCCFLSTTLDRGAPSVVDPTVNLSAEDAAYLGYPADMRIAHEPTLEQLTQFAESLKGRKVTLVAHSKGSFAQHLTSYLTAWGLDVSHVSTEPDAEGAESSAMSTGGESSSSREGVPSTPSPDAVPPVPPVPDPQAAVDPFILIDDDVSELRARLQKLRAEQAYPLNLHARKRPSLANAHRPRSSPQVARVMGLAPQTVQVTRQAVIVHYTSLANFKLVKDVIQTMMSPGNPWLRLPEVIVVPKPAGPRRILTALHTAVTKPIVDPFFAPIATSPLSPSFHPMSPLFTTTNAPRSPSGRSTGSLRPGSDRSTRSPKEGFETAGLAPSSPLGTNENMEYFSDAASKLGTSPSSGLVIQSPDGQPAGIFFHPKAKGGGKSSPHAERGSGTEYPVGRPRGSSYRRTSDADDSKRGFSYMHADSPRRSPRPPQGPDVGSVMYEGGTPPLSGKGKARQPSVSETLSDEPPPLTVTASETITPANAPKMARRTSSDPRSSPPLSPQTRQTGGLSRRPTARRPTAESSASAPAAIPKKGTRSTDSTIVPPISVLIVDDNPINQTILSTFMKKKKIKYDVAKNGEEAVHKWRSGGFHLILMDIQMPVMDGIQATKEIRRMEKCNGVGGFPTTPQSEGQQTPSEASADTRSASTPSYRSSVIIVALTASSLQSDRVAALAAGCNDFLTKPVSLHWLNNKIIEWGSIKALQMWADIRPEVVRSITSGQVAQARDVASKLHVPEGRTPIAPRSRSPSQTRKAVSLDAAMAAATSLQKADRAAQLTPSSDTSPASTSEGPAKNGDAAPDPVDTGECAKANSVADNDLISAILSFSSRSYDWHDSGGVVDRRVARDS
ncbi:hypothetical protein OH76DRAFT_1342864 [Lentinus brumalis]|uniref:Response regulatory domain-containing protein n=1 Tax=Lentinus brumalis TaxID=2498619 RepID=A0A371DM75_9APHY|nr:hypothetical protein OH76DRAFT_1342864 [Polyporus brumalis]